MDVGIRKGKEPYVLSGDKRISWPLIGSYEKGEKNICLPKISLVTPSFNQGRFLEETITSVLNQGYPNLEYMIIDGGSADESVEIIKKYDKFLNYWVSEPDRGQSHAINKGFNLATGDIVGWLNSDDMLLPFSLWKIGLFFSLYDIDACSGNEVCIDVNSKVTSFKRFLPLDTKWLLAIGNFSQPTIFWKRKLLNVVGFLNESLQYSMDYEYFLRLSSYTTIYHIDEYLVGFRYHKDQKSSVKRLDNSNASISAPYISKLFKDYSEFQHYCNICRLKEMWWYIQTLQFRRAIHPLKRFFRRNWRKL